MGWPCRSGSGRAGPCWRRRCAIACSRCRLRHSAGSGHMLAAPSPIPCIATATGTVSPFSAAVWLGPHASRAEQQAAWAVVRSLRFPALQEGTLWHGYYVLGRASRYPVGSVTTVPASSLPGSCSFPGGFRRAIGGFYLIHAPRAFYVIYRLFRRCKP